MRVFPPPRLNQSLPLMTFDSLHPLDLAIIVAYLAAVIWIGKSAAKGTNSEEGFFLAGRKLGKLYQFFLNFGNATEPQGATSTATLVYQRGAPGVWFSFQTVFMNPYFWFMNTWFRRVRLTTLADLFEDRFASKGLSMLYALFQVVVACVFLGFSNFTAYKIAASLAVKQEAHWTVAERESVESYQKLIVLEKQSNAGTLTAADKPTLDTLRDRNNRGELHSSIPALNDTVFYVGFAVVVGAYIVMGGMSAAAVNEGLQSVLIILFSVMLVPTGLHAIGGWGELAKKVPEPGKLMNLFSGEGGSPIFIFAVLFTSIVQNGGLSHNMGICGSAKNEFAARMGVTGNYLKRFMIILWAFAGLIAIALFGQNGLSDPAVVWGEMSKRLLGPGLIGLMLAGVIAGTMSTLAAKALAISSLFVRNVYRQIWPGLDQKRGVFLARLTIIVVLMLGAISAKMMGNVEDVVKLVLTVNVPFGAAVLLAFFWRRLTAKAVWWSVIISVLAIVAAPNIPGMIANPSLRRTPSLVVQTVKNPAFVANPPAAGSSAEEKALIDRQLADAQQPVPVFFKKTVRIEPNNPNSALEGVGRFNAECWFLSLVGVDVVNITASNRETLQFLFDGFFPFVVLIIVSLLTKPTDPARVAQFYGKMKTPVGDTPELEAAAMEETHRNPTRFDHTKLFPRSNWEFCKWDRVDTIGFIVCCAGSAAIIGIFVVVLGLARG